VTIASGGNAPPVTPSRSFGVSFGDVASELVEVEVEGPRRLLRVHGAGIRAARATCARTAFGAACAAPDQGRRGDASKYVASKISSRQGHCGFNRLGLRV